VTSDILLVLGAIGAIFDIIEGAILRSKLRDSINKVRCILSQSKYFFADILNS